MENAALPLYIVDAFAEKPFTGNPAAVCLISDKDDLSDEVLQDIAKEMNLSETAFVVTSNDRDAFTKESKFRLRWFTPAKEALLCGHATLASAAVLNKCFGNSSQSLQFETLSGSLWASVNPEGLIMLDFPRNDPVKLNEEQIHSIQNLINMTVGELEYVEVCYAPKVKYLMIRLHDSLTRKDLESLSPSTSSMLKAETGALDILGAIITLKGSTNNGCVTDDGKRFDFISRFFSPWYGIQEDPVTGSAHTVSGPYWSRILSKKKLYALQCSPRGGELHLTIKEERTEISGDAVVVVRGQLDLCRK